MKKLTCIILATLIMISTFFQLLPTDQIANADEKDHRSTNVLRIYNWEDYMDETVLDDFKAYYFEKYGIELEIIYETFDTNETMLTKIEKAHEDYDLACPSDYIIERMVKQGLTIPMDKNIVGENYKNNISEFISNQFAAITGNTEDTIHSIGYMWGTMGIMYNKNEVTMEELQQQGWGILWNPKFSNKIFMKDSIRDSVAITNIYVYTDEYKALKQQFDNGEIAQPEYTAKITEIFNRTDDDTIAKIEGALTEQKVIVNAMYDVDNDKNAMVNGAAYLDVCWSGDAVWAIIEAAEANNGVELGYYIPPYGTNIWFDGWVIPKYAKNTQAANEFVSYLLREDVSTKIMDYIGYTSVATGDAVLDFAKDFAFDYDVANDVSYFFEGATDTIVNEAMYPSKSTIYSSSVMKDYGENADNISAMWTRIKGNSLTLFAKIVLITVAILSIALIIFKSMKKHKKKIVNTHKVRDYTPE